MTSEGDNTWRAASAFFGGDAGYQLPRPTQATWSAARASWLAARINGSISCLPGLPSHLFIHPNSASSGLQNGLNQAPNVSETSVCHGSKGLDSLSVRVDVGQLNQNNTRQGSRLHRSHSCKGGWSWDGLQVGGSQLPGRQALNCACPSCGLPSGWSEMMCGHAWQPTLSSGAGKGQSEGYHAR